MKPFDSYPYLFFDLVLACMAALQAPIILMSQNRQDKRGKIKLKMDYKINKKTEILTEDTIKRLEKIDRNLEELKIK